MLSEPSEAFSEKRSMNDVWFCANVLRTLLKSLLTMSSERLTMNDVLDKVILREFLDMTHMFLAPLTQQVNIVML